MEKIPWPRGITHGSRVNGFGRLLAYHDVDAGDKLRRTIAVATWWSVRYLHYRPIGGPIGIVQRVLLSRKIRKLVAEAVAQHGSLQLPV